jgi:hypothetical protein
MLTKETPACVEYAMQNGPRVDDSTAWAITLAKWLKSIGTPLEKAPMRIARWFNTCDSIEELDDEGILSFCKMAYQETGITCQDMMRCESFRKGCTQEKCELYVKPVVPIGKGPTAIRIYESDEPGMVGVGEDGAVKVVKSVKKEDGNTFKVLDWISDCMVYIHTETIASDDREFIFEGYGAVDKGKVKFTLPAEALAEPKKFKAALINAFGAANRVGNLNFEMVQKITLNTIKRRRLTAPCWVEDKPMLPGVDLAKDIEYKFLDMIPAKVYDGDFQKAKETLGVLLDIAGCTPIIVTIILGSPFYARFFPNDRFGAGIWGRTGSMKTTVAKMAMCIFGIGYNDDANLLKHGRSGSTAVGELEIMASAGFLAHIIDNVKSVDPKDVQQYIATIHAVIEGKDKVRGRKEGGIRDSKAFCCTPIITGEIKPDEASTSARVLNLRWEEPKDKMNIGYVQGNLADLPVIGYRWLRYLAEFDFNIGNFEEARSRKTIEFNAKNYVNSGRLATIYSLVRATWNMLCDSKMSEVFVPRTKRFIKLLDEAIDIQGRMVSDETEVAKFMSGINAIIATQPHLIQDQENQMPDEYGKTYFKDVIGRWIEEDLFLVPAPTLAALKKLGVFTQIPTEGSITDALMQSGYLVLGEGGKKRKVRQRMNNQRVYGWRIAKENLVGSTFGDAENDKQDPIVPENPSSPRKKQESFQEGIEKAKKISDDLKGDIGDNGKDISKKEVIDSYSNIVILSPEVSPNDPLVPKKVSNMNEQEEQNHLSEIDKLNMEADKREHEKAIHDKTPINFSDAEKAALEATYQEMLEGHMIINPFHLSMMAKKRDVDILPSKCGQWLESH